MRTVQRIAVLIAFALLISSSASAYYFFVHFSARSAPYNVIPEKFDVNALRNKTVYFFVADGGPSQSAPSDSFASLVSELRLAAKVWNDVDSSDLRLAFGGLAAWSGSLVFAADGIAARKPAISHGDPHSC